MLRHSSVWLVACLLSGCSSSFFGGGGAVTPAGNPRITDLTATPNPARPGDAIQISFTAWDAGGGIGGWWILSVSESPRVGGRLDPSSGDLSSSPVRCTSVYTVPAPTKALIHVTVVAYGACSGLFCSAPSNGTDAFLIVDVVEP
jgi:hypothetical protein